MIVKYEFDSSSENFDFQEFEMFKQAQDMASCLFEIEEQLRSWRKWDERREIPVEEVCDTIFEIISNNVDMEKMGY